MGFVLLKRPHRPPPLLPTLNLTRHPTLWFCAEMVICKGHRLRENRSWDQGSRDQSRPPGPLPAPSSPAHSLGTTPGSSHVERPCPRCSRLSVSHTPGWRFERAHPLKQTATGRKCVPLLQLSLYENRVLQGGSQRLLQDDDLKNSSNLIPPSILESERPSPPPKRRKSFSPPAKPPPLLLEW